MKKFLKPLLVPFVLIEMLTPLAAYASAQDSVEMTRLGGRDQTQETPVKAPTTLGDLKEKFFPQEIYRVASGNKNLSHECFALPAYNFGVIVNNEHYQIYRSRALGEKGVFRVFNHLEEHDLAIPGKVVFMNKDGYRKSLISAAFPFLKQHIMSLDNFAYQEAALFASNGVFPDVTFYHPVNAPVYLYGRNPVRDHVSYELASVIDDHARLLFAKAYRGQPLNEFIVSTKDNFYYILDLILGEKGATLFHCTGGLHRTGMMALAIRYLQAGAWTEPFAEPILVSQPGGGTFKALSLNNLAEVEYILHNRYQGRQENLDALHELVTEPRFLELQEKYQALLNLPSRCQ